MESAVKAALCAIDNFNRVHGNYKTETTLILLSNAWELLAKAVLVKKKKNIYSNKNKKETISGEKAINQLLALKEFEQNQAELLQQIISLRNKCAHDVLPFIPDTIQHHLLFFSCKFFRDIALRHFPKTEKDLAKNFLTISFDQMTTYAAQVQKMISKLRTTNQGTRELAWLLERGVRYVNNSEYISQAAFENLYKGKKKIIPHLKLGTHIEAADMVCVVPVQAPQNFTADIQLRKGPNKLKGALPVHIKRSNIEDDYPFFTIDIANEIGKPGNTNYVAKAMSVLKLRGDDRFHSSIRTSTKGVTPRYSQAALDYVKSHLRKNPDFNPWS